jgi:hypothetical protein
VAGRWQVQATPKLTSPLYRVSCGDLRFCVAVGPAGIEQSTGRGWETASSTPQLGAVSCASASLCAAVGGFKPDTWDGARWTQAALPAAPQQANQAPPQGATDVSCPAPTDCVAVGDPMIVWFYRGPLPRQLSTELNRTLRGAIITTARPASISALLRHGAVKLSLSAPTTGMLTIEWRHRPNGHRAPVLIAGGRTNFDRTGKARIQIALTPTGERLLKSTHHSHLRLRVSAKASFAIVGANPILASSAFSLRP